MGLIQTSGHWMAKSFWLSPDRFTVGEAQSVCIKPNGMSGTGKLETVRSAQRLLIEKREIYRILIL